jgi:hypothetical protein
VGGGLRQLAPDDETFLRGMARVLDGLYRFCQDQVGLAPAPARRPPGQEGDRG